MDERLAEFVSYVAGHPGVSSRAMAERFSVSGRSVRNWVRRANEGLAGVAELRSEGGSLTLAITDARALATLISGRTAPVSGIPSTSAERQAYLLSDLLFRNDWVTLDDLADILYVNRRTISAEVAKVEKTLAGFGLTLERRPHYGIRVQGDELGRRLCLAHVAASHEADAEGRPSFGQAYAEQDKQGFDRVAAAIDRILEAHGVSLSGFARQNLLVHLVVAVTRVRAGSYVPMPPEQLEQLRGTREFAPAQEIADFVAGAVDISFPPEEAAYIAIHLASKRTIDELEGSDGSVISDEVWDVVLRMLAEVREAFRYDFSGDLELRMNLARHVAPLAVRLRYNLRMDNPMLPDIRATYPLAFSMAGVAAGVLEREYGAIPSEDEVGYLALLFALALERQREAPPRKRILVVCASGHGSAKLLEHRYRKEFGEYLESVVACDVRHVAEQDFAHIDYVFTTVPLPCEVPVPVREVRYFLNEAEVAGVRELLRGGAAPSGVAALFSAERFFAHVHATNKAEVLDLLCEAAQQGGAVEPRFRELVDAREATVPTTFGNQVAMPHPIEACGAETLAWVALLDEPVVWDERGTEVRAVFLVSFARDAGRELEDTFGALADLFIDEDAIARLVREQRFDTLMELLG